MAGNQRMRWAWQAAVTATVSAVLLSLVPLQESVGVPVGPPCGNATWPTCEGGTCAVGQRCNTGFSGNTSACVCETVGCCALNGSSAPPCQGNQTQSECFVLKGLFVPGGVCTDNGCATPTWTPTPTNTPTSTPTATTTPTNTPAPNGGTCTEPTDCQSGNCVDDVCCNTSCSLPGESCVVPGSVGTCTEVAARAPAVSLSGLALIIIALFAIGAVAAVRRRA